VSAPRGSLTHARRAPQPQTVKSSGNSCRLRRCSTPELTSTPSGRTARIASATFSGVSPPARNHLLSGAGKLLERGPIKGLPAPRLCGVEKHGANRFDGTQPVQLVRIGSVEGTDHRKRRFREQLLLDASMNLNQIKTGIRDSAYLILRWADRNGHALDGRLQLSSDRLRVRKS
jgi:hypothetical protein